MNIDKSKILTVVTADQAKVGQKGWFSDNLMDLEEQIKSNSPKGVILDIYSMRVPNRFVDEDTTAWNLFYPAPEPTYIEEFEAFIKENNIKEGTRVRITRDFGQDFNAYTFEHRGAAGKCGTVSDVGDGYINVCMEGEKEWSWTVPYYAMEIIKEPTYEERQAEWVKENGVKEGTKVRFTKGFNAFEDGSNCCGHRDAKGVEGYIKKIRDTYLYVDVGDDSWAVTFTTLEVIEEPTYRPYNNDELNDLVGEILTNKQSGRRKLVTGKPTASQGVNLDGSYITAKDLLSSFYRNTNKPCGIKE